MHIEYKTQKDLPCKELYQLFLAVGWAGERLVGCARVLSDLHFHSIIYDLAVLPEFQSMGIGKELVQKCINMCNGSEWLVQTDMAKGFYEKIGFRENEDYFLTMPCKWFG